MPLRVSAARRATGPSGRFAHGRDEWASREHTSSNGLTWPGTRETSARALLRAAKLHGRAVSARSRVQTEVCVEKGGFVHDAEQERLGLFFDHGETFALEREEVLQRLAERHVGREHVEFRLKIIGRGLGG